MTAELPPESDSTVTGPHELGELRGGQPGPLVVCVGGLHGNEPSGVQALARMLTRLSPHADSLRGRLVAFRGNPAALAGGVRYVDRDLNRGWSVRSAARVARHPVSVEDHAQAALIRRIVPLLRGAASPTYVLDLHTTSSVSAPFITIGSDPHVAAFSARLGMPLVRGIETQLEGTMLTYLGGFGALGVGIEAGQHDDPLSVELHEAALGVALVEAGVLPAGALPARPELWRRHIAAARVGLPDRFEIVYRRGVVEGEGFEMVSGYRNFEPIERGEVVARNRAGDIRAPVKGRLFLPLYQRQGDDAFFVIRAEEPGGRQVGCDAGEGELRRAGA